MRRATFQLCVCIALLCSGNAFAQEEQPDSQAWVPAVFFAASGAGVIIGTLAGVATIDKSDDLDQRCPSRCTADQIDDAREVADVSTAAFAIAGIAAIVGTVSLLLHIYATGEESDTRLSIGPTGVSGTF